MSDSDLFVGSKGDAVTAAQTLLNYHFSPRPPLTNLGVFDQATRDRVKEYQRLARIDDDGVVGIHTTKALLPVGKLELKGTVQENSVLPPVPNVQLPRSLRDFPQVRPPAVMGPPKVLGSPGSVPDFFSYNRQRTYHLDNVQLSLGNETDIPKGSDSAPVQFAIEFTWLKKRDTNPQPAAGAQFSYTPISGDGKWSGQFYGKIGLNDWPMKPWGPVSFTNPSFQAYIKKAAGGASPWTAGAQVANETDVKLYEKAGSYSLSAYLNIAPLQLDILNLNDQSVSLKAASTIGIGFKFTIFAPEWKNEESKRFPGLFLPPGVSDR